MNLNNIQLIQETQIQLTNECRHAPKRHDNSVLCPRTRSGPRTSGPPSLSALRHHDPNGHLSLGSLWLSSVPGPPSNYRRHLVFTKTDIHATTACSTYRHTPMCSLPLTDVKWLKNRLKPPALHKLGQFLRARPDSNCLPINLKLSGSGLPR